MLVIIQQLPEDNNRYPYFLSWMCERTSCGIANASLSEADFYYSFKAGRNVRLKEWWVKRLEKC